MFETTLITQYGILVAAQPDHEDGDVIAYAVSRPGRVNLAAGTDFVNVEVQLERWTTQPDEPDAIWEDGDELPWLTVADDLPLIQVSGFELPEDDDGLGIEGLGRARVQILSAGRNRYCFLDPNPSSTLEEREPERWLLRFWPDPDGRDAVAGPPRRIGAPPGAPAFYRNVHADVVPDLLHLARWAPGQQLTSTPQRIADRLGVPVAWILTALTRAAVKSPEWFTTVPPIIDASTEFELAPFRATRR